jgi:hypothetical protein
MTDAILLENKRLKDALDQKTEEVRRIFTFNCSAKS